MKTILLIIHVNLIGFKVISSCYDVIETLAQGSRKALTPIMRSVMHAEKQLVLQKKIELVWII